MLDFITDNTQLLSVIVASTAGVFSVVKWLDSRRIELQEKRYSKYMEFQEIDLMAIVRR